VSCHDPTPTHQQLCVDAEDKVVEDAYCPPVEKNDREGPQPPVTHGGGFVPYYWYYMPYRAGGYPVGFDARTVPGGSRVAPLSSNGRSVSVAKGRVVTGGFGSTYHGGKGVGE
jgi:hypothetical protein